jgi:hypothetical protein
MVDATLTVAPPAPIVAPVALSKMKPPELAKAINEKIAQMTASARTSVQHAMEIGDLLIEAKKRVGHGKFEKWRNDHCQLSPATARRCMELAEQRPELEKQLNSKTLNVSDLNLTAARRLLAPPKPPTPEAKKPEPTPTDHYTKIESDLIKALLDLDYDLAKGCADRTIGALNDTIEDIESAQRPKAKQVP